MNKTLRELLEDWIDERRLFSMGDLTAVTGLSRQAIHTEQEQAHKLF